VPEPKIISLADWKALEAKGLAPDGVCLRKAWSCDEVLSKAEDPKLGEREIGLVISTKNPDRDKDTMEAEGWDLRNYRKNPVVLWAHDYRSLPIARARKVQVADGSLKAIDHFVERDVYPLAEIVLQMLKRGYLNAASVGFMPLKWARNEERGGIDFEKMELLEHSIVPVPANAEALVELRTIKGLDLAPLVEWAERFIDDAGGGTDKDLPVDPRRVAEMLKEARGGRVLVGWTRNAEAAAPTVPDFTFRFVELGAGAQADPEDGDGGAQDPPAKRAPAAPARLPGTTATPDAIVQEDGGGVWLKQGFVVQSLIFPKAHWTSADACRRWARDHDFKADKVDETADSYRLRQRDPADFERFRTICLMPNDAGPSESRCRVKAVGGPLKEAGVAPESPPRFAHDDLEAALVVSGWLETIERGVIPYRRTPLAPEGESWDGAGEFSKADVDDLRVMCTWFAAAGENKGDFKLPHHKAGGEHACVWRGVANGAARLPQTQLPAADMGGVRRHLGRHYEDFGKEPPWKAAPEAWERFEISSAAWAKSAKRELAASELSALLREFGFEAEGLAVDAVAETAAVTDLLASMGMPAAADEPGGELVTDEQLRQMHRDIIEPEIDARIRQRMGRLD
jgi:HK97 family phage prohead protease